MCWHKWNKWSPVLQQKMIHFVFKTEYMEAYQERTCKKCGEYERKVIS